MADSASLMLDAADREAVCGDLVESGESGLHSLQGVLSLIIRRRASYLREWRPWLTVICLTVPLSDLLSLQSRRIADGAAIYLWLYVNNWDWAIMHNPGFWLGFMQVAPSLFLSCIALASWSWTTGLLVGCFARRALWFQSAILLVVILAVGNFGMPQFLDHILVLRRARDFPNNAAVFFQNFYRQIFPLCLQLLLVGFPAWIGMLQGRRMDRFRRSAQLFLLTSATAAVGALICANLLWWQMRVWNIWPLRQPRLPSLMPVAIAGPAAYLLLTVLVRWIRPVVSHTRVFEDR